MVKFLGKEYQYVTIHGISVDYEFGPTKYWREDADIHLDESKALLTVDNMKVMPAVGNSGTLHIPLASIKSIVTSIDVNKLDKQ